ncbi:MAG: molybdopterin-dependent oxidoreductase [Acidobacteria bacterium]|nr:molybdopterin-dependent oxidoreductase [Candidatus Sulfomarinibacter sp. MAG AM2]
MRPSPQWSWNPGTIPIGSTVAHDKISTHFRACNLCEATCGIEIEVREGAIVSIRGDREDPFSRGHICPKAVALQDIYDDPDRLRHPMRRTRDGDWEHIGWEAAFDLTAERIRKIQSDHGLDAVGVYLGNPNVHNLGSLLYGPPLVRSLRTRNCFSATSVDRPPLWVVVVVADFATVDGDVVCVAVESSGFGSAAVEDGAVFTQV